MEHHLFKKAFTLAEVLITLGIIGIVAALTMPVIIGNYQKKAAEAKFKKSYSVVSQALQKILSDDGVERLSDSELWKTIPESGSCKTSSLNSSCDNFMNGLRKYLVFNVVPSASNEYRSMGTSVFLSDGTELNFGFANKPGSSLFLDKLEYCDQIKSLGGTMCTHVGEVQIDINGLKGPDLFGADRLHFVVSDEGKLYPYIGKDDSLFYSQMPLETNTSYWKNKTNREECPSIVGGATNRQVAIDSAACTARIVENGWKIDF